MTGSSFVTAGVNSSDRGAWIFSRCTDSTASFFGSLRSVMEKLQKADKFVWRSINYSDVSKTYIFSLKGSSKALGKVLTVCKRMKFTGRP
ncbi:hypothetical protein [Vibrio ezurae]|uniref:Uncharacterized protein n=1 Tax=Vibrio ezurae NBRC 102218 TaxID=1219080 RepID=U3CL18_9VIBR|nr:hypothetical protein [Vibrio ezurae]GAD78873.1 hypothetical protein VEZ01S_07_00500 [Vibrio ezurae NBRC 102218]